MKNNINSYDLIIIGAGPAGLTAAIYAKRAELNVLVIEKGAFGGKMIKTYDIANYPGFEKILGVDLAIKMHQQATALQVKFLNEKVVDITFKDEQKFLHLENSKVLSTKAVIIATGTLEKELILPKENSNDLEVLVPGVKELYGHGVSYCAVCDGAFFRNENIVVVGGGDSAIEEAIYLTRFAKKVFLVHRRKGFRASEVSLKIAKNNSKIEWLLNYVVKEIKGKKQVSEVIIENTLTKELKTLSAKAIFPYIGSIPMTDFVSKLDICNKEGYVITNNNMETKIAGIYAVGDVRNTNLRQIATAVGDGALATQQAVNYIDMLKNRNIA